MARDPIKSSGSYLLLIFLCLGVGCVLFLSCQRELSCENCLPENSVNKPPIANAGADQVIILPTNATTLDGTGSTDVDNNIITYRWTKIAGPATFSIQNANAAQTQISQLVSGVYQFELNVTDAGNLFSKDTVTVTVISTLSGQEFVFDDLIWELGDFYGMGLNDIYVGTPPRPDLFFNAPGQGYNLYFPRDVYLKFDTASTWLLVKSTAQFDPNIPVQYVYDIISPYLYVHVYALNYGLVGRKASIKVKFL